jgi:hypothetical protein
MHQILLLLPVLILFSCTPSSKNPIKPRIIISTDIGGTDPDDNQSMTHMLMYSDMFEIEGLVSSPSYGDGSKAEILRMIDLYEKDLPQLKKHRNGFPTPDYLRSITKQGRKGGAPYKGYMTATEGSDWIITCAREESDQPLWVLVWGGLDDLAQALHDAPDIQSKIRVYWIGGPNKKWSANSYAFITDNFPDLWFIEANASYRGFFSNTNAPDSLHTDNYYNRFINASEHLGKDFKNYYGGRIKMGDTPSLLYLMHGDPDQPMGESWGGSFEKLSYSPSVIFERNTTLSDTIPVYSIIEFHLEGPVINIPEDSSCFTMTIANQTWSGYYRGDGNYAVRYAPKQAESLAYSISSKITELDGQSGEFVVDNRWPGDQATTHYDLGHHWYTDRSDPELFDVKWQGAKTVAKWRNKALQDWAERWSWLRSD